jgi:hypothetical protein
MRFGRSPFATSPGIELAVRLRIVPAMRSGPKRPRGGFLSCLAAVIAVAVGLPAGRAEDTPPSPGPSPSPATGALTPDEHREVLDRQLDASLSAFDAMLLKEQQAAAAKRAEEMASGGSGTGEGGEGEGEGSGGGGGTGGSGGGKGGQKGDGKADRKGGTRTTSTREGGREGSADDTGDDADRATGSARGGSRPGGGRSTTSDPEGAPPSSDATLPPPDVGDGRDDDVVARQIREAAMKEEDPAIREKLWDEYRRYKGIRTGGS